MKAVLHHINVFVKIVESGSITKAAKQLSLSKSVISHHLRSMEQYLGGKLLTRTTRSQALTEVGAQFYHRCVEVEALMKLAEDEARESAIKLIGPITVISSTSIMTHIIAPSMCDFTTANPCVEPVLLTNEIGLNLIEKGVDLCCRTGKLLDSSYRAIKLGEFEEVICTAPVYMQKKGEMLPIVSTELTRFDFISISGEGVNIKRTFYSDKEQHVSYSFRSSRVCDSELSVRIMALAGLGIACLPKFVVAEDLKSGALVRVLPQEIILCTPLWVLHNYGVQLPVRVRAFIDLIKVQAAPMML